MRQNSYVYYFTYARFYAGFFYDAENLKLSCETSAFRENREGVLFRGQTPLFVLPQCCRFRQHRGQNSFHQKTKNVRRRLP